MDFISKDELEYFKNFCKAKGIKDSFINYIVWKDRFKDDCSNRKDKR